MNKILVELEDEQVDYILIESLKSSFFVETSNVHRNWPVDMELVQSILVLLRYYMTSQQATKFEKEIEPILEQILKEQEDA